MKQLLVFLFLLCAGSVSAQDVIVKKDGSTIVCRVVELTSSEIVYKRWNDLNGSNYVINLTDASAVNYENGTRANLSKTTNLNQQSNLNSGGQQYNDKALLRMDFANQKIESKIKNLKTYGWISGIAGLGIGALLINLGNNSDDEGLQYYIPGGACALGGVITSVCCFITAQKKRKQAEMYLQSSTIYQYDFNFADGTYLSAGIDMLSDRSIGNNTIGLGLRYNF